MPAEKKTELMSNQAKTWEALLQLASPPVAVAFRKVPPRGVSRIESVAPAGCSYWKLAAEGHVFYTKAEDHYECPIGAYTHGIELPAGRQNDWENLIGVMLDLDYLRESEMGMIPRRKDTFGVAVYAPWFRMPCEPDVVLIRGNAKQMMLLSEAVRAAGIHSNDGMMGRPTCAMIPATSQSERPAISLGCIGNRVYNQLTDDQIYSTIPGKKTNQVLSHLKTVIEANRQLERFHGERLASLSN